MLKEMKAGPVTSRALTPTLSASGDEALMDSTHTQPARHSNNRQLEFWSADHVDPRDRQSWKRLGQSGPGREFVYLLSDASGALVYVGITWNPFVRWTHHARNRPWWHQVAFATVWVCPNDDARRWETICIKTMRPSQNIHQAVR